MGVGSLWGWRLDPEAALLALKVFGARSSWLCQLLGNWQPRLQVPEMGGSEPRPQSGKGEIVKDPVCFSSHVTPHQDPSRGGRASSRGSGRDSGV